MTHTCPVCGYGELTDLPEHFSICPSCGTEFGYDDDMASHAELRQRWIAGGAKWWDIDESPPPFWSPVAQLRNIGYAPTNADLVAMASTEPTTTSTYNEPERNMAMFANPMGSRTIIGFEQKRKVFVRFSIPLASSDLRKDAFQPA